MTDILRRWRRWVRGWYRHWLWRAGLYPDVQLTSSGRLRINGYFQHQFESYADVLKRDPCVYCHGKADTMDHIYPRSRGGKDSYDNLAPACETCNKRKRSILLLQFLMNQTSNYRPLANRRPPTTPARRKRALVRAWKAEQAAKEAAAKAAIDTKTKKKELVDQTT